MQQTREAAGPHLVEAEVDLREGLEVLIRRKNIFLSFFIVPIFVAAAYSFLAPRVYEITAFIEPPIMTVADSGPQNFDSIGNIKAKIAAGVFNGKIISDMNLRDKELRFGVSQIENARLIKISMKMPESKTGLGVDIVTRLLDEISRAYAGFVENKRSQIDNRVKTIAIQIATKENEIRLKSEQLKILAEREKQFVEEIKETRANSQKLLARREALLERKEGAGEISSLLYTTTIQQNLVYITQLQNQLAELKSRKEDELSGIENLKNSIKESQIEIRSLDSDRQSVRNVAIIQAPQVSTRPVGPKRKLNLIIAAVVGLVAGVFSAFFVEYWEKPRK